MPTEIKLWQIDNEQPCFVPRQKLDLEARIEDWLRKDITLVSNDLLVIGQQLDTAYGGVIDLLAIDPVGNLVILELKRDKTPRDIVAQCLDYASWVKDLTHDSIHEFANAFLKDRTLDQAFQETFHTDLPDVLNERHRIYIVASSLDSATERIVRYLSETHNVDINVATFAYFKTADHEFLGRSLLLDESEVQTRAESKSKRTPPRSWEELQRFAEENGVERQKLIIDPGLGFGKRFEDNLKLIKHVDYFRRLRLPLMLGPSRKSFLGQIVGKEASERDAATAATVAYAALKGVDLVRVHNVSFARDVISVMEALKEVQ